MNIMGTLRKFKMSHNMYTSRDQLTTFLGGNEFLQSLKGWFCFVITCNGLFFAPPHPEEIVFTKAAVDGIRPNLKTHCHQRTEHTSSHQCSFKSAEANSE